MSKSAEVTNPSQMLPLTPAVFHVLLALSTNALHGYAIMREVERLSEGTVTMGPGTLYGTIKRLRVQGLVEESDERPAPDDDDERRRYYRLTGLGERVLEAEVVRLRQMIANAGGLGLRPGLGEA